MSKPMRFALIGRDVLHSLSKRIHERLFSAPYDLLSVPEEDFERTVPELIKRYDGFNVTMPYKARILPFLAGRTAAVSATGSCNSVRAENGKLYGDTTDGAGFLKALGTDVAEKDVLLLGAGGAAAALAYAVAGGGARLTIANRTPEKAEELVRKLKIFANTRPLSMPFCEKYDIIINATSVGSGDAALSPLDFKTIPAPRVAADIVCYPLRTGFLRRAKEAGAIPVDGFGMLFWQAVLAEEFWRREKISEEAALAAYADLRKEIRE